MPTEKTYKERFSESLPSLGAGAIAGGIANLVVTPIDAIADTMRSWNISSSSTPEEQAAAKSAFRTAKQILKEKGVKGFYKGSLTKMFKIVPAMAIQFALYDALKEKFSKTADDKTHREIKKLEYHLDALRMSKYLTKDPYVKAKLDEKIEQLNEQFSALNRMQSLSSVPTL